MGKFSKNKGAVFTGALFVPALIMAGFLFFGQSARAEADWQNTFEYYNFDSFDNQTWEDVSLNKFDVNYSDAVLFPGRFGNAQYFNSTQNYTSGYNGPENKHVFEKDGYLSISFWYRLNEDFDQNSCKVDNCNEVLYKTVWCQDYCTNKNDFVEIHLGDVERSNMFKAKFLYNIVNQDSQFQYISSGLPTDQSWHNIVIVWKINDPAASGNGIWVDGVKDEGSYYINPYGEPLNLLNTDNGCYSYLGPYNIYNIAIDDLAIVKSDITPEQIAKLQTKSYGDMLNEPPAEEISNPVIFVPGILGSSLYEKSSLGNTQLWPGVLGYSAEYLNHLIQINNPLTYISQAGNLLLNQLAMDENGNSLHDIFAADAIRNVLVFDVYGGLINSLKADGYQENKDLFLFPYDWRLDIDRVAGDNSLCQSTTTLKCLIEEVKRKTGADKVDIIAHSMGGLVVKDYVAKFGQDSVGKFIDIATPHLGAPLAAKVLNYGDNLGFPYLAPADLKNISQNMPAIYQLLPGEKYFNLSGNDYNYYLANSVATNLNLPTGKLDYLDSFQFLAKTGADNRGNLLDKNYSLHSEIDNVKIADSYNISGCKQATIGKIISNGKKAFFLNNYRLRYISGDDTVPLKSSDYYGDSDQNYYLQGSHHRSISGDAAVSDFIKLALAGKADTFDFSAFPKFSQSSSSCAISGKGVSFHCPADLHVYNGDGDHAGPLANGDIENNIPGVRYDIIDGNKFVFLPQGGNYKIIGNATGIGVLELAVDSIGNGEYNKTTYFNGISLVSTSTKVELNLSDEEDDITVNIDADGDRIFEQTKTPDAVLTGDQVDDFVKPDTTIDISGTKGNDDYYVSAVKVNLSATDDNSGVLKTEYSLDNGITWLKYDGELTIASDGLVTILYSSTDRAGNHEENKSVTIKIDQTQPVISALLPQEGQEVLHGDKLNVTYFAADNFSGLATATAKIYLDGQNISSSTVDLFRQNIGAHQIKITVQDLAGNQAEQTTNFSVVADIDSTIADVNRAYDEKMITRLDVRNNLIGDLNNIKRFQEKYGQRVDKEKARREKALAQCLKHKNQAWCEKRIGALFDRIEYRLNKIDQAASRLRYNLILAELDMFLRAKRIDQTGYNIIREDVKYLISEL